MDDIISLCRRRGFIFPSGDIYGGLRGFWDYGPLGAQLKKNIKDHWWRDMIQCSPPHYETRDPVQIVPFDGSIISNPDIWEASGHAQKFRDDYYHCKNCNKMTRSDEWDEDKCPSCKADLVDENEKKTFDLMFKSEVGVVEGEKTEVYLRPETAQSIFVNFANVLNTMRVKIPFGIAQIGKAYRNEVTPRNFTFRSREFEQMEIEFFVKESEAERWYRHWINIRKAWWSIIGLSENNLDLDVHHQRDLAHYAQGGFGVTDIQYKFPFGYAELEGIAHRTDFDLKRHASASGQRLNYYDSEVGERYVPHVIEPSAGLDRGVLALLCEAYTPDPDRPTGLYMSFSSKVAPVKVAFFPLVNKQGMPEIAERLYNHYSRYYDCVFDAKQTIGKRYARMDEIGTPYCITIDGDTLEKNLVTVRFRDTMEQITISIEEIEPFLHRYIKE